MRVRRYEPSDRDEWDAFVDGSKNGTFLFKRDYMDYHAERFSDSSLIVEDAEGRTAALLPANRVKEVVQSHAGLTYGGFITDARMTAERMLRVFEAACRFLAGQGCTRLEYKTVPHIYHTLPSEEDLYALFRFGAQLVRRDVLSVVDLGTALAFDESRLRALRKAKRHAITVEETQNYSGFWTLLVTVLGHRHGVAPVHSAQEMELLHSRFPEHIRLFCASHQGLISAGAVVYLTQSVCHLQYSASNEHGRASGALDLVLDHIIRQRVRSERFFDFGASTEQHGTVLNQGLVAYKEGFGARAVAHDFYELSLPGA